MCFNHLNPESVSMRRIANCRCRKFSHRSPFYNCYLPTLYRYFVLYWHLTALVSCMYPTIYSPSPLEHPRSNQNFTHPKLKSTFVPAPVPVLCAPISDSSCLPGAQARNLGLISDPSLDLPQPINLQFPQFCLQNVTNSLRLQWYHARPLPTLLQQPQTLFLSSQIHSPHRSQSGI